MSMRFWEAWTVEPDGSGGREVTDECGHLHDSLEECKELHGISRQYNAFVAIEYSDDGDVEVVREVRNNPRRPKSGFGRLIFDMVNS